MRERESVEGEPEHVYLLKSGSVGLYRAVALVPPRDGPEPQCIVTSTVPWARVISARSTFLFNVLKRLAYAMWSGLGIVLISTLGVVIINVFSTPKVH